MITMIGLRIILSPFSITGIQTGIGLENELNIIQRINPFFVGIQFYRVWGAYYHKKGRRLPQKVEGN